MTSTSQNLISQESPRSPNLGLVLAGLESRLRYDLRYENGTVASNIQYDFIDNYCGRDDEVNWGSLEIIHSGSAPQAVFWIESFHFSKFEEAQFKIYCTLSLCVHSLQFCNLPGPDHN